MNLTALVTPIQIVQQGFLDSLACATLLPGDAARALDIGSGGGFPAIPLALIRPGLDFTLIEPSRKKVTFLRHVVRQLELSHVQILAGRIESFSGDRSMLDAFDVGLARAVAPLHEVGRLVLPFLRPSGVFLAQVGPAEHVDGGMSHPLCSGFEVIGKTDVPPTFGKPGRSVLAFRKFGPRWGGGRFT
jgi:16S rRNA (guanine527-N7)-methyltransferase